MKVIWDIGVDKPIEPSEPLPPIPDKRLRCNVLVITGRAPIWRYAMALHKAHGSPAAAIAVHDPGIGDVIVMSHSRDYNVGDILPDEE